MAGSSGDSASRAFRCSSGKRSLPLTHQTRTWASRTRASPIALQRAPVLLRDHRFDDVAPDDDRSPQPLLRVGLANPDRRRQPRHRCPRLVIVTSSPVAATSSRIARHLALKTHNSASSGFRRRRHRLCLVVCRTPRTILSDRVEMHSKGNNLAVEDSRSPAKHCGDEYGKEVRGCDGSPSPSVDRSRGLEALVSGP
jgi:hypothetical protein